MSFARLFAVLLFLLPLALVPSSAAAQTSDSTAADADARFSRVDPHASRLFYKPTARPLGRGTVAVSATNVFLPQVAVGISDAISVEGGVLLVPDYVGDLFVLTPIARLAERDRLQIAVSAGAYAVKETDLSFHSQFGSPFPVEVRENWRYGVTPRALLTYGTDTASLTTSVGVPIASHSLYDDAGSGYLTLGAGGGLQVFNWLKVLTENDVTLGVPYRVLSLQRTGPTDEFTYRTGRTAVLHTLTGARFFWDHFAIDLGGGVQTAALDEIDSEITIYLRFSYLF
jgi:hypothetical protein